MQAVSLSKIIEKMELVNLTPEIDVESIKVEQTDINRPALQLTGFFDHFPTDRVPVIGYAEEVYIWRNSLKKSTVYYFLPGSAARRYIAGTGQ